MYLGAGEGETSRGETGGKGGGWPKCARRGGRFANMYLGWGGGVSRYHAGRSQRTIDPRLPIMPGFQRPGRHCSGGEETSRGGGEGGEVANMYQEGKAGSQTCTRRGGRGEKSRRCRTQP